MQQIQNERNPLFGLMPFSSFVFVCFFSTFIELFPQLWASSKRCFKQTIFPHFLHSNSLTGLNLAWQSKLAHFLWALGLTLDLSQFDSCCFLHWCDSGVRWLEQYLIPHNLHSKGRKSIWLQEPIGQWNSEDRLAFIKNNLKKNHLNQYFKKNW